MDNANIFTTVTVNGDTYTIKKFSAKTGLKLARLVLSVASPIIESSDSVAGDGIGIDALISALKLLSDDDMESVVDKCLRVCYKNMPAGMQPVIDATGNYGVPEAEYDLALTVRLCVEAIKWGASGFFGEKSSPLSGILTAIGSPRNP